jgi:hypothetical protein
VDGFQSVDFTLVSDREISFGAPEPTAASSREPISKEQEHNALNEMITKAKNILKKVT